MITCHVITCHVIVAIQSAAQNDGPLKGKPMNKIALIVVLVLFSGLSAYAVLHAGGVLELVLVLLRIPEGWQVMADLIIVMCLFLVFMKRDAEASGRPFWPWAIFSLIVGAFGPLLYFITKKEKA